LLWIDVGWLPDAHPAVLSPSSSTGQREKIRWKSSLAEVKTGTSLANYHHRLNALNLRKISCMYCQLKTELGGEKQIWELNHLTPTSSFFPGSAFLLHCWGQSITVPLCCFFRLTLFPASVLGPCVGCSPSRIAPV